MIKLKKKKGIHSGLTDIIKAFDHIAYNLFIYFFNPSPTLPNSCGAQSRSQRAINKITKQPV